MTSAARDPAAIESLIRVAARLDDLPTVDMRTCAWLWLRDNVVCSPGISRRLKKNIAASLVLQHIVHPHDGPQIIEDLAYGMAHFAPSTEHGCARAQILAGCALVYACGLGNLRAEERPAVRDMLAAYAAVAPIPCRGGLMQALAPHFFCQSEPQNGFPKLLDAVKAANIPTQQLPDLLKTLANGLGSSHPPEVRKAFDDLCDFGSQRLPAEFKRELITALAQGWDNRPTDSAPAQSEVDGTDLPNTETAPPRGAKRNRAAREAEAEAEDEVSSEDSESEALAAAPETKKPRRAPHRDAETAATVATTTSTPHPKPAPGAVMHR